MSDEQDKLRVSLEPPKLFGRKKKADAPSRTASAPAEEAPTADAPVADEPAVEDALPEDTAVLEAATEETAEVDAVAEETAEVDPVAEETADDTAVIDAPEDVEPAPAPPPTPAPAPRQPAQKKPAQKRPAEKKPAQKRPAEKKPAAKEPAEKTAAAKTAAPASAKKSAPKPASAPVAAVAKKATRPRAKLAPPIEPEPVRDADLEDAAITAQDDDGRPLLDMYPAAAVTGVVVGAVMVLLTWLSLRGCEAVRDTSTCGGGPGFVLLVATFVLCILLGSTLLKAFQIPDPGSSSFLAVGLVAVVALLFLIDVLDHWSMIIVIPVLAVGAYLASVWVTKTFVEPGSET